MITNKNRIYCNHRYLIPLVIIQMFKYTYDIYFYNE